MFPKNGEKVPELRFAGFADDWEERKLGELGSVAMNRRIFKDQTSENEEVPFFKIGTFGSKPDAFISRELFEEYKLKYPYPEIGDVLISASGSIGRTVVYQGEDEYFQDSNIVWLKHDNRLDNKFLKQFYSIVKWQGLEGSTIKRLYNKNILDTDISIPSTIEQNKIGMFFEQLDDTIALHQRKCDQTKELKKTMLQKMFPKKGERIPEIRFPEFTDEWEEKKLGEVVDREIKGKAKANMQGTKSIYLETEYLNGGETTFVDSDADIEEDDILILWDGSQAGTVYHGFFGALGSTLKAYRPKESGKFVYYQLVAHQEMIFQRYRTPNIPHVIKTFTDEFSVFTTSLSEQERIGNFFKHLDTLIALHQSKCDSLKELKKTLLRQLFV